MALMFHRGRAIPLWAIAFFTVAHAAPPPPALPLMPPTTLFVIALAGIAVLVFVMPGACPRLHSSRSLALVRLSILPGRRARDPQWTEGSACGRQTSRTGIPPRMRSTLVA